ncbi:hypothetical protein EVAR_5146_1 [Eumeta japonica]|uniref:Uncharacterized protein n=1 Tax=Eumeta variegata TaxID=151549 RepID=A0A4C1SXG0_EUMVA|nr:hypothetical protein EVAR_5146_1 [Eumeta japonica]
MYDARVGHLLSVVTPNRVVRTTRVTAVYYRHCLNSLNFTKDGLARCSRNTGSLNSSNTVKLGDDRLDVTL